MEKKRKAVEKMEMVGYMSQVRVPPSHTHTHIYLFARLPKYVEVLLHTNHNNIRHITHTNIHGYTFIRTYPQP